MLLFLVLLFACAVHGASMRFTSPTEAGLHDSGTPLEITFSGSEFAADDNTFAVRLIECKALLGCGDSDWWVEDVNTSFEWSSKGSGSISYPVPIAVATSSDYQIQFTSAKTGDHFRSDQFTILNKQAVVTLTAPPASEPNIFKGVPFTVSWSVDDAPEDATVTVTVENTGEQKGFVYTSEPIAVSAGSASIVPAASWGNTDARVTLAVAMSYDGELKATKTLALKEKPINIIITKPTSAETFRHGDPIKVVWTFAGITPPSKEVKFELEHDGLVVGQIGVGKLEDLEETHDLPVPTDKKTSFGYRIKATSGEVVGYSEPFLLRDPDATNGNACTQSPDKLTVTCAPSEATGNLFDFGGGFELARMEFEWNTCATKVGTSLNIEIEYRDGGEISSAALTNKNYIPHDEIYRRMNVLSGTPFFLQVQLENIDADEKPTVEVAEPAPIKLSADVFLSPFDPSTASGLPRFELGKISFETNTFDKVYCKDAPEEVPPCADPSTPGCDPTNPIAIPRRNEQTRLKGGDLVCPTKSVNLLNAKCGDQVLFEGIRAGLKYSIVDGVGLHCGDTYYVEAYETVGGVRGFLEVVDWVQKCAVTDSGDSDDDDGDEPGNQSSNASSLIATGALCLAIIASFLA